MSAVASGGGNETLALLDWLWEECDVWRFVALLEGWSTRRPSWWSQPATQTPTGWASHIRSASWGGVGSLGDVVTQALQRARAQAASPPIVDLQPRP